MAEKILVIEDEPSILKAMEEGLSIHGYSVAAALDATRGLELVDTFKPDLILLDLVLPGMNGFEALQLLKRNPATSKIPVIILSNLGDEEEIRQGLSYGAVDFLIKADNDLEQIVNTIKKYLLQAAQAV